MQVSRSAFMGHRYSRVLMMPYWAYHDTFSLSVFEMATLADDFARLAACLPSELGLWYAPGPGSSSTPFRTASCKYNQECTFGNNEAV